MLTASITVITREVALVSAICASFCVFQVFDLGGRSGCSQCNGSYHVAYEGPAAVGSGYVIDNPRGFGYSFLIWSNRCVSAILGCVVFEVRVLWGCKL